MSFYLVLNLSIILIPFIFSFEKNLKFYRNFPYVFFSIIVTGGVYLIWDYFAVIRGDWSFNPEYLSGIYFLNLPIEEILFFITVPYACIFIYETIKYYVKENILNIRKEFFLFTALLFAVNSFYFSDLNYSATVLFSCALFFLIAVLFYPSLLMSRLYWLTMVITFIPFLIVNYLLTSLPVVSYNKDAIWGIRILTIPLEDFFYSFSMISFYLLIYHIAKQKLLLKKGNL